MHTSNHDVQALKRRAPQNPSRENVEQRSIEGLLSYQQAAHLFSVIDSVLVNRVDRGRRAKAGNVAGSDNGDGYLRVRVDGVQFRVHRIVWLLSYGRWPDGQIDHINGVPHDNRIENLREVTAQGNQRNQRIRIDNTSGITGVSSDRGLWTARIKVDGQKIQLGRFKTIEEAAAARKAAEKVLGFHPNHGKTDSARRNGLPSLRAPRILRTS